ncbi:SOUL family heme-binding protein [Halapricum hydrolyticum]|uniref:Heme-binding protein n=1 Tax=Halapricum hydrolyticum TaxID=2979991 RepID=A0AAE3IB80_9EURY|nr:heme-binding protein [Halapricum hydrolyticum]MCU4719151.1 heme-binding protein [Halapricum hydrolyticum]MCU4727341.1 heme-binding protein [Halapricum hydrolyticum]
MERITKAVLVGASALLVGWIGWGIYSTRSVKSVPYERVRQIGDVELRRYPRTVLVETTADDQRTAFRRLFRYISGANDGDESISMTAPVETQGGTSISMTAPVRSETAESEADAVRMAFYLPAEYDPDTAPEPTDPGVELVVEPEQTIAVTRFSWYAPEWQVERQSRTLLAALESDGIEPLGEPTLLRYNDPWTPPFLRRNEVAVEVAAES